MFGKRFVTILRYDHSVAEQNAALKPRYTSDRRSTVQSRSVWTWVLWGNNSGTCSANGNDIIIQRNLRTDA